jgi:peptide/nickel transport system ATP-binding protein
MAGTSQQPILSVRNLSLDYVTARGAVQALRDINFDLYPGEVLALMGESGSGKSTLGFALIRMNAKTARIRSGSITYYRRDGKAFDILRVPDRELRKFRWQECAMVLQSALNAFNPVMKIEEHFYDTARAHGWTSRGEIRQKAAELLRLVQLDPNRVLRSFPHELSGGMRQRVLLAMGLLLDPPMVILDEPTTALDILTQRTVIELLRRLQQELGFSLIFISHDLSIAAELADRVGTMYAGKLVEIASVYDAFYRPFHPYTYGLIRAVPTVAGEAKDLVSIPGSPPDLVKLPPGCKFHARCAFATERCMKEEPALEPVMPGREVACYHWRKVEEEHAVGGKA